MEHALTCPHCGNTVVAYRNPAPTTDVVIYEQGRGVVLVKRKNPPYGYALPGGFIDDGESAEHAAVREMLEETHLCVRLTGLLGVYSAPDRDPRRHTLSVVFVGRAADVNALRAGDDAAEAAFWPLDRLPTPLAFDHGAILQDFCAVLRGERALGAVQQSADGAATTHGTGRRDTPASSQDGGCAAGLEFGHAGISGQAASGQAAPESCAPGQAALGQAALGIAGTAGQASDLTSGSVGTIFSRQEVR